MSFELKRLWVRAQLLWVRGALACLRWIDPELTAKAEAQNRNSAP